MGGSCTIRGWSCDGTMTGSEFSAAFLCRCHPVHFLLFVLATMNQDRFNCGPENLQFGESAAHALAFLHWMSCYEFV